MSLIQDNQRKTAQEPEPKAAPLPKSAPVPDAQKITPTANLQEFEQGQGELGFATEEQLGGTSEPAPETMEAGTYVEFAAGQPEARTGTVVEPGQGYLTGLQGQLGQSLPEIPLPAVEAASTPPLTNLWKDATVDLGIPNLGDSRLTTATYPALYNTPFRSFDPGVGNTFVQGANASAQAEAQAQQQQQAARARAIQEAQQRRGALPNTPDASKPWNEQLWGWASDVLLGTEAERQQEQQTGKGTFGAYGSGLGGFFKSAFGVPIALAGAVGAEGYGRISYETQKRIAEATNPYIITSDGKTNTRVRYNSATAEQKHQYALSKSGENLLFPGSGNTATINYDPRRPFGSFVGEALAGEIDDSVSNANPKLPPVIDKRTGKPAQVERPRGLLFATNKRPGQGFFDDPGSAALEVFTQLFSPGNKVDAAGELLGLGLRALARTNAAKATGIAIANAVPQPIKQGVGAVANVAKRTVAGVATGTFGQKPVTSAISQPTQVVGVLKNPSLPRNTGAEFEAYLRNQQNGAVVKAPVVPDVPAFVPTTTPVLAKTDPEGLAAVVGIGQKGQPLTFEPTVGLRTHEELVQQVLRQNPEKFGSYRGSTWAEWDAWKKANLSEEDVRQLEAVGAVQETTRVQTTATLDDLQTQARVLAEQKLSVEAPLKQLEEVFDETVDVGRRTIDNVPLRPLTEADVIKAIDYVASLRLSRQLPASVVEAAAKGDTRTLLSQAEAFGGIPGLVQAHNQALTDLSSRITPELVASSRLATDLPPTVYHGTALAEWRPYNVVETGSRGELGSALYTTRSYDEAAEYSRASVGNNRPTEIAYDPLAPQVVALDTSKLLAPLDARLPLKSTDELVQAVVRNLPASVQENLGSLPKQLSFSDLTSRLERATAEVGGSEGLLKQVNDSVSDTLRASGYDSAYDPQSGWLAVIDNGKLSVVKQEYVPEPSAVQAAVARYNADSLAAGHYPSHVTSDANLRDSSFQVLDQARNQLDEKLEEVQQQLQEATYKEDVKPLVERAKELSNDTLKARVKEPPSVERYKRDIQEFGQPLHPVVVREYATDKFELVGNPKAFEAAVASYDPRTYSMVAAMVEPLKQRSAGMYRPSGYYLVDIRSIDKRAVSMSPMATIKADVLKEFNKQVPEFTTAPVVLEQTSFETFRVLDRGFTANAYSTLYKRGEQAAEMVPAIVIDKSGKADFFLVDLSSIEKAPKALEPEVPKLEEAIAKANGTTPDKVEKLEATSTVEAAAKPVAKTSADLRKLAKELKVDVSEVNFRSKTQRQELQKLLEQKQSEPKVWQGLSPSRQADINKRMQTQPTKDKLIDEIVVEPPPTLATSLASDLPEASTKALSSTEAPKAVDLEQAGDLAMRMFEYSNTNALSGKNTNNWATPALSGGIRLDNGVKYLKGFPIHKQFDLEQDVVGYASQLLREKATIEGDAGIFAEASATLGEDVPQYFLSVAQQVVEKLAKEQPEYLAKAIKRADKRTSAFVRYADDLLNNREDALPNLQKSISAFLEKQKSPEYLAKAEKAKAVASTNEFADDYDALEAEFYRDIEEAKAANPHTSLTDALDEVQAGKYDICDL